MKTKRQEQFRTGFRSVQRLHSWVTAKALMLLVMLMVSVQGAWAQETINHITYEFSLINNEARATVVGIEDGVQDVVIPSTVEYRGYTCTVKIKEGEINLFRGKSFKSVTFVNDENSAITEIPSTFEGCTALERVILPKELQVIDQQLFKGCTKLSTISIPEKVTAIRGEAFSGCTSLRSISIPEHVTELRDYAFYNCTSLGTVHIPNGVTYIGSYAFTGCTALRYVEIPNSVSYLGAELREDHNGVMIEYGNGRVFEGCTSLESVKMSNSITVIPKYTFNGCTSLYSFEIPEGVTQIGNAAFVNCPLSSLSIPASLKQLGLYTFTTAIPTLTSITVAPGNPTYDSRDNCNAIIETSTNRLYLGCRNTVIPEGVTVMNDAFENCVGLTTLTLPKSVTLNLSALKGCSNLTTINCKATDPGRITINGNLSAPNIQGVNFSSLKVVVPYPSLELYKKNNAFKTLFYIENIEADPLTEKFNYISDVNFGSDAEINSFGNMDWTSPIEVTSLHKKLAWNNTTSMFNGVTGILYFIVDSQTQHNTEPGDLQDEYVIDGKIYRRLAINPSYIYDKDEQGLPVYRFFCPYITRDGNNISGADILSTLEVIQSNEPQEDPDFVKGVRIISRTGDRTISGNQDWAAVENSGDDHTYIYVKATYKTYQTPLDEVHYTTTDGSKLNIATNAFGGENVFQAENHTYKDGAGVIKFDKAVEGTLPASIFAGNTKVQKVMLPPGITEIANGAFEGCTALENISFSQEMVSIGTSAFKGCSSLLAVTLPNGLKTLGEAAFEGCSSLASVSVPQYITTLAANTFKGCSSIASVVLPSSITSIGASAFEGCGKITNVNFKDLKNLASFGSRSFYGCASLKEVEFWDIKALTNDVEAYTECEIGSEAFANCSNLKFVSIQKLTRIGAKAFDGSAELFFYAAKYSGNMSSDFADDAFSKDAVRTINLNGADQITEIPAGKFQGYWNLNRFTFPDNLTTIGANAFAGSGMWSLNISHLTKLTDIGEGAFSGCEQLGNIVLPSSLTTVKASTFKGCINLRTLNFNNSVQSIGEEAFANCPDLQTVVFGPALQSIGSKAFAGCKSNMEVVTNLVYEGIYASNLDCFDESVYSTGILHMIGDTKDNDAIYNNAPWSSFTNKDTGGTYYYVQDGSTYRLYPDNYEMLDGRRIRGAVLIDGKSINYPNVVNEDFPVVAFAAGSISGEVGALEIPGSVIRLEEGFISPSTNIWGIGFDRGSDTLYVDKTLNIPMIHNIRINRDVECLNGGLFEGFHTTDPSGITLTIDRDATYLPKNCFRNANIIELIFRSNELFGFEQGALAGCKQIRNIHIYANGQGMDETRCFSNTLEMDVIRNATVTWDGPEYGIEKYQSYQPWVNFVEPEVTQVTIDNAVYKIYPRLGYSYNIKKEFGVHNITGAVLTGSIGDGLSGDVVIPDKVHGFPVIAVAKGPFYDNDNVTSISFPGTLRMIENNAVEKMGELKTVEFRDQMFPRDQKCYVGYAVYTAVDEEAFYKCDNLEEVIIGCNIDWEESEDEPFEDRENLKTVRITRGCNLLGKESRKDNKTTLFRDCENIKNIYIYEGDEPLQHNQWNWMFYRFLSLDTYYLDRELQFNFGIDYTENLIIGPHVKELDANIKAGTVTISEGNVLRKIKYGFSSPNIIGYCPNLEVIGLEAFLDCQINRCFWFDPEHPEESHLKEICEAAFLTSSLRDLYLPPSIKKMERYNGWHLNNVYFYGDPEEMEISKYFFYSSAEYGTQSPSNDHPTVHLHFLCSRSDPGKYTKSYFDAGSPDTSFETKENNDLVYAYDVHSLNSKKGDVLQSDGLYHDVCAGCGELDRSAETGNYYIHNWNGADDIMIHKDGYYYTYAGPLAIDDSKPFQSPVIFSAESVSYNRTVNGGRVATFVLPFEADASEVNGTVYKFREFKDSKFCFDEQTGALDANTPYLVVVDVNGPLLNTVDSKTLYATANTNLFPRTCIVTDGTAEHIGRYVSNSIADGENGRSYYGYAATDGAFVKAKTATLNPFRTMFTLPQSSNANARIRLQLGNDDIDGIIEVDADELDGSGSRMYDLNGRVITSPVRGQIYIQNGKKISSK